MSEKMIKVRVREGQRFGSPRARQYQAGEELEVPQEDLASLSHCLVSIEEDEENKRSQLAKLEAEANAAREVFERTREAHMVAARLSMNGMEIAKERAAAIREESIKRVEQDLKIELPRPKASKRPDLAK